MIQYDARGGYATDLDPEQMPDQMLLAGDNLYYKAKIRKRPGWTNLSTDATINTAGRSEKGFVRAKMNSTWYNITAHDDGSDVNFYYGDTGAYTGIDAAFDWTTGVDVQLAVYPLGNGEDVVIAVNGTEKPAIIYYDSGFVVENLEAYDEREIGNDQWFAGQWDDSESPEMVDDTTDAQSTTIDDFQISSGTNDDGFYVSSVQAFNKVVITNCPDLGAGNVADIEYYAGAGVWTNLNVTSEPDWNAAEGDKTLEFDLPLDGDGVLAWEKFGDVSTQEDPTGRTDSALNKYIIRVIFTTADAAGSADFIAVSNTQYLTLLFLDVRPQAVAIHQERVFLAAGNSFRYSPPNQVTGWQDFAIEYCKVGGEEILQMVSGVNMIHLFKKAAVYRYEGTTTLNFVLRSTVCTGAISRRGATFAGGVPTYVAPDGIRAMVNNKSVILSNHIKGDIDGWTLTDAVAMNWNGDVVISLPTDGIILWADPDTIRTDEMGDGQVSLWKWAGLKATQIVHAFGDDDNGYLIGYDPANRRFVYATSNGYDVAFDTTQSNIDITFQSKYHSQKAPGQRKAEKRMLFEISKSGDWTLTLLADNGLRTAVKTIASGTGSGHVYHDTEVPYGVDGFNLSVKLANSSNGAVSVYGYTDESKRRVF